MNNGGPAFPTEQWYDSEVIGQRQGMSLRDWLAGQASEKDVQDIREEHRIYHPQNTAVWQEGITRQEARYLHADRMLKARGKS